MIKKILYTLIILLTFLSCNLQKEFYESGNGDVPAEEFLLMHANYVFEHPAEKFEDSYKGPFHVAYGRDKKLAGELGEWLCFIIQDQQESICIAQPIDGVKILPGKNYTAESLEAAHNEKG